MKLTCSLCPEHFKSVIIDKDAALLECSQKLYSHVQGKHNDLVKLYNQKLTEIMSNASGRLFFTMFVNQEIINGEDDRENHIMENFAKNEEELCKLLGLDLEDDDDEETEETEPTEEQEKEPV